MKMTDNVKLRLSAIAAAVSLVFVVSLVSLPTHGASFDCTKAKTTVEKTICADPKLSKLDEEVNAAYSAAKNAGNSDVISVQQRAWLKERNACKTSDCIEIVYARRLKELQTKPDASPVLRQIARSGEKAAPQTVTSAEDFFKASDKEFPPYPDIWGVDLPLGVSVSGIYPAGNGDFVVGAYGKEKSTYNWVSRNKTYLMTGLFSGKQWRIADRDPELDKHRNNDGDSRGNRETTEVPCPVQISPNDPNMRKLCYAEIDHVFPNRNRLLYIRTDYGLPFCYRERYFKYFVLLGPDGNVLRQVTPIVISKSNQIRDALGDEPPCYDYLGGKTYKKINNWTMAPEPSKFVPLLDGTFLLGFNGFYEGVAIKKYLMRFDQNFTSLHPAYSREVFMMDSQLLEKMGSIHSDPRKTIHENALQTDRNIYDYLTNKTGGK